MASREIGIRFAVVEDEAAMSRRAAALVLQRITGRPDLLLCLATGASPTGLYQRLVQTCQKQADLFRQIRVIKLDEWHGLAPDNPATCQAYLQQNFIGPMKIDARRYTAFRPDAADPEAECRRISRKLAAIGPIDLAILGLGRNGHLGLNEPGEFLTPDAHVAKLTQATLGHQMLKVAGRPVRRGLTLGMAQLLQSREVLLLVCGESKRPMMRQLKSGRVSTQLPGSMLHLHPNVTCICDRAAIG